MQLPGEHRGQRPALVLDKLSIGAASRHSLDLDRLNTSNDSLGGGSVGAVVFDAGTYWCYWKPLHGG